MTDQASPASPGTAFWVIGAIALLWNLIGLLFFYSGVTATPELLAEQFNAEQVALIQATPVWAELANGVAVIAGVLGSILLLLRNRLAVPLYVVSIAALIVQDIYVFGMSESVTVFGPQPLVLQGTVLLFAIFLAWYSRQQRSRGVLR